MNVATQLQVLRQSALLRDVYDDGGTLATLHQYQRALHLANVLQEHCCGGAGFPYRVGLLSRVDASYEWSC